MAAKTGPPGPILAGKLDPGGPVLAKFLSKSVRGDHFWGNRFWRDRSGNRDPTNYRPISLTSTCCKIMEHVLCHAIMKHLELHHILNMDSDQATPAKPNLSLLLL